MAKERVAALDARLLLQHITGLSHAQLIARPETRLSPAWRAVLDRLLERRAAGEPLAYLTGEAGFFGRSFKVTPAVLVPRPETEELTARALAVLRARQGIAHPRALDLGTGSGVIAISLALEYPAVLLTAVDCSQAALSCARANAEALGAKIRFLSGDWFSALAGERFHLIVANPPYLAAGDPHLAADGLRREPRQALTDEADGRQCLRAIIRDAPRHLEPGGWLLCEHGHDQGEAIRGMLRAAGFPDPQTWRDMTGNERISGGERQYLLEGEETEEAQHPGTSVHQTGS
jgi:release factor glutamine methyltransferase